MRRRKQSSASPLSPLRERNAVPCEEQRESEMRVILMIAGAALAVAGCSGGNDSNEVDTLAVNNLVVDDGTMRNGDMTGDMNAMTMNGDMNAVTTGDMNGMPASNVQELQQKDLTTNDADTNLANEL
jgi:hypothetical protein